VVPAPGPSGATAGASTLAAGATAGASATIPVVLPVKSVRLALKPPDYYGNDTDEPLDFLD